MQIGLAAELEAEVNKSFTWKIKCQSFKHFKLQRSVNNSFRQPGRNAIKKFIAILVSITVAVENLDRNPVHFYSCTYSFLSTLI